MRARTSRLKSACLVMIVSPRAARTSPSDRCGERTTEDRTPVREVNLPLPPELTRLGRVTRGSARTAAARDVTSGPKARSDESGQHLDQEHGRSSDSVGLALGVHATAP